MIIGLPVLDDMQGYADLILSLPLSGQKRGEANIADNSTKSIDILYYFCDYQNY